MTDAEIKILREIDRIPGRKKHTNTNIDICCPFHQETGPSCGIYVVSNGKVPFGWFNCFGCPAKGPWNVLAEKLGLEKVSEGDYKVRSVTENEKEAERRKRSMLPDRGNIAMPYGIPYNEDEWREIPGDLIREVGGILGFDEFEKIAALFLPVRVEKKLVAVVKARLASKKGKQSYIVQAGGAQVKQRALYPYDKVEQMLATGKYMYLVIVEGPRDALKLIAEGIPALSILGAAMWSNKKRRRVISLCNRYSVKPLVMMDGDKKGKDGTRPGTIAQKIIVKDLSESIQVEKINLVTHMKRLKREKLDPAELPNKMYKDIRKLVHA